MEELKTEHRIYFQDAREPLTADRGQSATVQLVVTSPPYPMIAMWDELFSSMAPDIREALAKEEGDTAFEAIHRELDRVWSTVDRLVVTGGFVCVNIGDATRTIGGKFQLFSNHTRITRAFIALGYEVLPLILWRKPTNSPNKFMGAGMLPAGAYVTLEHEYILIFRKQGKRIFKTEAEKTLRRESAFFWEERNVWFSDIWQISGIRQGLKNSSRERSAAYPFELAYRLINMYSVKGDTVLDPFLGTGTTTLAALCACRNSVGVEIDPALREVISPLLLENCEFSNRIIAERLEKHRSFVEEAAASGREIKHRNRHYDFPVITSQEKELKLDLLTGITASGENVFLGNYKT